MPKEISMKNAGLFTLVLLIVLMLISGFRYGEVMKNATTVTFEDPISKNTELVINPGETFIYTFGPNETSELANISFYVEEGAGCTLLVVDNGIGMEGACVDEWGNDEAGLNETLESPDFFFFRPWMLALRENWRWKTRTYVDIDGYLQEVWERGYRVMRVDTYKGRTVFVIEVSSEDDPYEYLWIDYEKRVLVKAKGEGYYVELMSPLN